MNKKIVFCDFDGTLTHGHELRSNFFSILEECQRLNAELIITTGRSLSWGQFFLTHFPMKWAIVEGGGAILSMNHQNKSINEHFLVSSFDLQHLKKTADKLLETFPGLNLSSDSFGRKSDRAIEYFPNEEMKKMVEHFLNSHRMNFSSSNVHLNFWSGEVSKYKAITHFLKTECPSTSIEETIYFGDSLNDQSVFKEHPHAVGVANIDKYLSKMNHPPKYILKGTDKESAEGVLWTLRQLNPQDGFHTLQRHFQ